MEEENKRTDQWEPQVNTKYKTVDKKIRPIAVEVDGSHAQPLRRPPFDPPIEYTPLDWPVPVWEQPRPQTQRITPERLAAMDFGPPGFLHDDEREALIKVTLHFEMAFSFDRSEKGLLKPTYADPYRIRTVPHEPWIGKSIPLPKARMDEIKNIYAEQIREGDIEPADGPYMTPHFFVAKKNGKIRKVVDMSLLNAVTIRDANIPPNITDFCEELSGRVCYGSGDGHSFFDQISLHPDSRPMTAIRTIHGMYQSTRLPQGATNSPAYAQRVSTHIFLDMLGELVQVFVDDLVIKGPRSDYDNKKLEGTNLRLWFLEYLRTYAIVLRRYQHAGLTLSGEKFVAITPRISITGIVVDRHGKHSDPVKVAKLEDWPCPPPNISSLRGFLGLANYLRPFIKNFAVIDAPLRKLLTGRFRWNDDATVAMEQLKQAAKQQPILVAIDYSSSEPLVLAVDSSQIAAGWALYQGDAEEGQLRKLNQYGSVGFSEVESRYSQPQLELCGVFKAVKQLRHSLYGTFFILEVDAASLRQMINSPDIPNAAMTRWVQYLKLFNHQIRHVPGRHHTLPDGLSRTDFDTVEPAEDSMDDKIGLEARALGIGSADTTSSSGETKQDQQTSTDQEEEKVFGKAHYTTMGNDRRRRVSKDGSIKGNHEMGSDSQRRAAVSKEEESKSDHDGQARDGDLQGQTAKASYTHITPTTTGTLGADIIDWRRRATEGTSRIDDRNGESQGRPAVSEEEGNGIARETDDLRRQTVGIPAHLGQTPEDTNLPPEGIDTPEGTDSEDSDDFLTSCDTAPDDTSSDSSTEDPANPAPLQRTLYSDKWLHLAEYLHSGLSFQVLKPLAPSRRQWVKNQIGKFFVRGGRLYRRGKRDIPLLVIDTEDLKQKLLHEAHEQHGHRGRDATVSLLLKRVWWEKLAVDCLRHVLSCDPCQRRQQRMHREPARHAPIPNLFERFNMDIVDLGQGVGPKRYLVVARDALTGWPEARLLSDKTSASVRTFLEEDVFSRYGGTICTILTDNGPENSGETKFIVKHLGFKHAFSTQYNPEGNTEVERGHGPLVEGMLRASYDDRANIAAYLPYALWADRITTRRTTSYSPFELVYGMDPIIPMDIELSTFVLFDWDRIQSTTDLIAARTRQLKRRMDDLHLAKLRLEYSRQQGRTYADTRNSHLLRDPLPPGSLVIVSNPKHDQRAEDRWFGPYRVTRQLPGGSYALTELNGTPMDRNYAAKHVRQYFSRSVPLQTLQDNTIRTGSHPAGPSQQDDGTRLVIDAPSRVPTSTTSAAPERLPPLAPPAAPAVPLRLPRARMTRPALPHRDIPPTRTIHPQFTPYVLDHGIVFPADPPLHGWHAPQPPQQQHQPLYTTQPQQQPPPQQPFPRAPFPPPGPLQPSYHRPHH